MTRPPAKITLVEFPDAASSDGRGAGLQRRWEALLGKVPRLRPWLAELLTRQRRLLAERGAGDPDRQLWAQLSRLLHELEALPQFAVSAIATTLHDEDDERGCASSDEAAIGRLAAADSPESAVSDLETLLGDPAFALAFHCCEARIFPLLQPPAELARVPQAAWLGLLHACAPQRPVLTAATAVALVLRALSTDFARLPAPSRSAALRLFCASPDDLQPGAPRDRLFALLPAAWLLSDARGRFGLLRDVTRFHGAYSSAKAKSHIPEFRAGKKEEGDNKGSAPLKTAA